jgi:tagaturonate reductase
LAERWLAGARAPDATVRHAMEDAASRSALESLWAAEVLPVFDALGQRPDAETYLAQLRERLLNPFLDHRLSDIAQNHAQKKQRRFAPIVALAVELQCAIEQPQLRAALASQLPTPKLV